MNIGELRLIPAGIKVWSIALQKNVIFDKDVIVEITNTIYGDDFHFFGKMKTITGNIPGFIPGIMDDVNGDLGSVDIRKTNPYEMPKADWFMTYEK
jgi:hypothetical protein